MIELEFIKSDRAIVTTNEYETIGGLPINLKIDKRGIFFEFNSIMLMGDDNFIELMFNLEDRMLNQLSIISINNNAEKLNSFSMKNEDLSYFKCYLKESVNRRERLNCSITVTQYKNIVSFNLLNSITANIYKVADRIFFGVNLENNLCKIMVQEEPALQR